MVFVLSERPPPGRARATFIRLRGFDPAKRNTAQETNLMPGRKSSIDSGVVCSGDFLMTIGIDPAISDRRSGVVLEVTVVGH